MKQKIIICFILMLSIIFSPSVIVLAQQLTYRLQPEDILHVTVYEQPDLETKVRITSNGEITLPLIGKVKVTDFTVSELREKIEVLLEKDYLVNPQVQVFIEKYHVKQVSVLGSVKKPGKYDMHAEMMIL